MKSFFALFLALSTTSVCLADGSRPEGVSHPNEIEKSVHVGFLSGWLPEVKLPDEFVFFAKTDGFAFGDETVNYKHRYLRIKVANFMKLEKDADGRISFADFEVTPVTKATFQKSISGERETLTQYGPIYGRYQDEGTGYVMNLEAYPIGWGYSSETVFGDEELDAKAIADEKKRSKVDIESPTYDPIAENEKRERSLEQKRRAHRFWNKFVQVSADVLGASYVGIRFPDKGTNLLGGELVRFQTNTGLALRPSGCTKINLSVGGLFRFGMYGASQGQNWKMKEFKSFGDMDAFARAELLANFIHWQFTASVQAGTTINPKFQEEFGGLSQAQSAVGVGGGDNGGGSGDRPGLNFGDMIFGGGGHAEGHPYLMLNVGGRF